MGMPITVDVEDKDVTSRDLDSVFDYFKYIDESYSPFKKNSEVGKVNRGESFSSEMKKILKLADVLKEETGGYFDIKKFNGKIDPSGVVKGWSIKNAADILRTKGFKNFFVDAGGDAEIVGKNWKWGIRNPFNIKEIVKVLNLSDVGIATSGTYERGQHIYDPVKKMSEITDILSLTVIGPNVFEADSFATPAFAMGKQGISFIEARNNLEGYMIDKDGIATMTSGFEKYI
jgi:thiamine biosynthesis lipoprotein